MGDIRKDRIVIITEANQVVATGHLLEAIELAKVLSAEGWDIRVLLNDDAPEGLKEKIRNFVVEYPSDVEDGFDEIAECLKQFQCDVVVTDLRKITNEFFEMLKGITTVPIICIDELGRRRLEADYIINPMVDSYFWEYDNKRESTQIYAGAEYLILPQNLQRYHKREKVIAKNAGRVCVSMGGVDPFATAIKIADWLIPEYTDIEWDIVVGAGFRELDRLKCATNSNRNVNIYKNIDYIYELFYKADIAFCAGGNTLHELVGIGTPAIVIPSMPHEINNGKTYEQKNCCACLSRTTEIEVEEIKNSFLTLLDYETRVDMSRCQKETFSGEGLIRTKEIIEKVVRSK